MRWRDRFEFVMGAVKQAEADTGERKGHYLNVTAGDMEEIYRRAELAKELGSRIIMVDYLVAGFTAFASLSKWCRANGMLLHAHRAMHSVMDRQQNHGMHWRVLAKWCRIVGADHLHNGTVVGKLEGDRTSTIGINEMMRATVIAKVENCPGHHFDQPWLSMPGMFPVASGGIHVWNMPELVSIFGDDAILQFGGGTVGHPWGSAAGATANRVALEAGGCASSQRRPQPARRRDGHPQVRGASQRRIARRNGNLERHHIRIRVCGRTRTKTLKVSLAINARFKQDLLSISRSGLPEKTFRVSRSDQNEN